jgi:uncharacterized metal-binding protein
LGARIAPRCTIAEGMLIVGETPGGIAETEFVPLETARWTEILALLVRHRIDTLVCGGIPRNDKLLLGARNISVVENVACTTEAIVAAIAEGRLRPGLGFGSESPLACARPGNEEPEIDCLSCRNRVCLRGESCRAEGWEYGRTDGAMLESARDVACEDVRTLCRLSELIYFCLEMKYRKVGVAYCLELAEPARILARVLRRFFEVAAVCCKIGGVADDESFDREPDARESDRHDRIACNPAGQAGALNDSGTELNVIVGLCMGVDCVFTRASNVPVSTLFVKDKSLANNPIGALYSDYYLKEAIEPSIARIEDKL